MNMSRVLSSIKASLNRNVLYGSVPYDSISIKICQCLYKEGYLSTYCIKNGRVIFHFKFFEGQRLLNNLRILYKPSFPYFLSIKNLKIDYNIYKYNYLLATPRGILTSKKAIKLNISGLLLAELL